MTATESNPSFVAPRPEEVSIGVDVTCAEIDTRIADLDGQRRVPADLYDAMVRRGLFRQLVPRELGGVGLSPLEWFEHGVRLAARDASVGWVVTQGAAELGWIANGGDPGWAAEVLADPAAVSASTIAGQGTFSIDDTTGTGTIQGRWGFDTGCHGATWIGGLCAILPAGDVPEFRFVWVPAERAEILDDWNPSGLLGSGSNSIVIPEQQAPITQSINVAERADNDRGPYRTMVGNGNWPIAVSVAATQLGASQRALDEAKTVLMRKLDPFGDSLTGDSGIQVEYMEAAARWHAAHALVQRELTSMWRQAEQHGEFDGDQRIRLRLATINANQTAVDVVGAMTRVTGTTTINPTHPLTRACRDVIALQGHIGTCRKATELAAEYHFDITDELAQLV